jgi:GNAT superfamily N-acetyltransferase
MEEILTFTKETSHEGDNAEIDNFLASHWGSTKVVSKCKITNAAQTPRIVSRRLDGRLVGLLTYVIDQENHSCEVVTINSEIEGAGIGTKLLGMVESIARENGCKHIWLITTNDNPEAAAFYVKRGYRLTGVHLDALEKSRGLKPQIPEVGKHGIRLTDEWEFEKIIELGNQAPQAQK